MLAENIQVDEIIAREIVHVTITCSANNIQYSVLTFLIRYSYCIANYLKSENWEIKEIYEIQNQTNL